MMLIGDMVAKTGMAFWSVMALAEDRMILMMRLWASIGVSVNVVSSYGADKFGQ